MSLLERVGLVALRRMDPETAHGLALRALQAGLTPQAAPPGSQTSRVDLAGLSLPNPVGLAAGFDKNATAIAPLLQSGFGFIEVGAVTPRPQPGNPRPRLFRLTADRAAINRFGFNNDGAEIVAERLAARPSGGVVGLNLGANKDSADKARDFAEVLRICGPFVDFATVNVSSPNTEKLRDLQGREALTALLSGVMDMRAGMAHPVPIFLKVAPDLDPAGIDDIVAAARETGVAAIIATNTTLSRAGLCDPQASETGGLSGAPLKPRATRILAEFAARLNGDIPLIGVGGIETAADAMEKIHAGASAVQLYTGLVYHGLSRGRIIAEELDGMLRGTSLSAERGRRIATLTQAAFPT